jgi:hypothetical protein
MQQHRKTLEQTFREHFRTVTSATVPARSDQLCGSVISDSAPVSNVEQTQQ